MSSAPAGRVLVIGPSRVGDMAWFLAIAYLRLGWQVVPLDDRAFIGRRLPGTVGTVVQVLERDHRVTRRTQQLGALVRKMAKDCDHAVTVKGEYLLPEDVAAVAARIPFVNWHPDHPMLDQQLDTIPHFTAYFPKDDWTTGRLRAMGHLNVMTLPHASDPKVLHGARESHPPPSLSVVGGMYPYRRHWIERARTHGVDVKVWGSEVPDRAVTSQRRKALGADQGRALRTGCFTLNTHHPHDIAGANQRLFDAAAAGAPQLTELLPDSVRHFEPDLEIATFQDSDEFDQQLKELVTNAALRDRLAKGSHERLRSEHTYEHRINTILGLL